MKNRFFRWLFNLFSKKKDLATPENKIEIIKLEAPTNYTPEKKSSFQRDLEYLENNRSKVIQEKEDEKPNIIYDSDKIIYKWGKVSFLFDKEGFDFFNNEFNISDYVLCKDFVTNNVGRKDCYLRREHKKYGWSDYFHREFMKDEIEEFSFRRKVQNKDIIVHHKDRNTSNNIKSNLQVMTREEHDIEHNRM